MVQIMAATLETRDANTLDRLGQCLRVGEWDDAVAIAPENGKRRQGANLRRASATLRAGTTLARATRRGARETVPRKIRHEDAPIARETGGDPSRGHEARHGWARLDRTSVAPPPSLNEYVPSFRILSGCLSADKSLVAGT